VITTKLSTKGQIIIPTEIRRRQGWDPGQDLEVEERGDTVLLRPIRAVERTTVDDLLGCLPFSSRTPKTIEEMDAGIAQGARRQR